MREIKFRAWDKIRRWMLYEGESCGYVDIENHEVDVVNFILSGDYNKNLTFMQYTGLVDKNGREIYEGDILSYWGFTYTVIHQDAAFGWIEDGAFYGFMQMALGELAKAKIVGNIYENPELLEGDLN